MQNDSGLIQAHIFKSHRRANHVCGQAHNPALSGTMTKPVTDRRTTDHRVTDRCTTETSTTDRYAKSKRMNDRQAVSSIGILPVVLLLASCSDRSRYASPDANIATLADAKHVRVLFSRMAIPFQGHYIIAWHPPAISIHNPKIMLRLYKSLFSQRAPFGKCGGVIASLKGTYPRVKVSRQHGGWQQKQRQ